MTHNCFSASYSPLNVGSFVDENRSFHIARACSANIGAAHTAWPLHIALHSSLSVQLSGIPTPF